MRYRVPPFAVVLLVVQFGCRSYEIGSPSRPAAVQPSPQLQDSPGVLMFREPPPWLAAQLPSNLPAANDAFLGFYRVPAKDQRWVRMTNNTAYFDDYYIGGLTLLSADGDGDVWDASLDRPDGFTVNWNTVTFHSSYNGSSNCWVGGDSTICGTTQLYFLWYTPSRCGPDGDWTMHFFDDVGEYATGTFSLADSFAYAPPQWGQGQDPWGFDPYDNWCKFDNVANSGHACGQAGETQFIMADLGCYVTALTAAFAYHGFSLNPGATNDSLAQRQGGYIDASVQTWAASQVAASQGLSISVDQYASATPAQVRSYLCRYGPVLLATTTVSGDAPHHWVLAVGIDPATNNFIVNDPDGAGSKRVLDTAFSEVHVVKGPNSSGSPYPAPPEFDFLAFSPVELVVTDPNGRRTGFDPNSNTHYSEILASNYATSGLDHHDGSGEFEEWKDLTVKNPAAGEFTLDVIGVGTGVYDLKILFGDAAGSSALAGLEDVPTSPGVVHRFTVTNTGSASGEPLSLAAAFDGGGQRPRDVNGFLSYVYPSSATTTIPVAATSVDLLVLYGASVTPGSFSATRNGASVTALFHAVAGTLEHVSLPLDPGRNVIILSINGVVQGREHTDRDRLVFVRG